MKKLLMACFALVFAASVHAADFYEVLHTTTSDTTTVFQGAGFLHKIIVSSAGVSSYLSVSDSSNDTLDSTNLVAGLDTTSLGEYEYNVGLSSGLTYTTYGGTAGGIDILYRRGNFYPSSGQVYESSFTVTADDGAALLSSQSGVLYKVICASATAAGTGLSVYDAIDAGEDDANSILKMQCDSTRDDVFNIVVSSGLTYTTTGSAGWSIMFKRGLGGYR